MSHAILKLKQLVSSLLINLTGLAQLLMTTWGPALN
jgi:hypothetical protein